MCVGMGTVFLFLLLLIAATEGIRVMFGGAPAPAAPAPKAGRAAKAADDAARAAAVIGAVTHHKRKRQ